MYFKYYDIYSFFTDSSVLFAFCCYIYMQWLPSKNVNIAKKGKFINDIIHMSILANKQKIVKF